MRLLSVFAVALLLAGCFGGDRDRVEPEAFVDYAAIEAAISEPLDEGHDHSDAALHEGHYNLDRMDLDDAASGRSGGLNEGFIESAVKGNYAYIARGGQNQGLVIFDIADVEHPKQVSFLSLNAGFEPDIEVSDDGNWGFWETQRAYLSTPPVPSPTGANLGDLLPHGIDILDLRDKAAPKWVGFQPILPDGPHSITYANVDGRHLVLANAYSYLYVQNLAAPPQMQRLIIFELDTTTPIPTLRQLATYIDPNAVESNPVQPIGDRFPHDVTVERHPVTGQWLAYIAYWDLGVVTLDITDPSNPLRQSAYADFGPAAYADIHMARAFPGLIAGRHVVVTEPEIAAEADTGYLTFVDMTDPATPSYISSWKIPGNSTSLGGSYGPHYFDAQFGRVALASYHAGFWVVDVHNEANLLHPKTVGYAFPQSKTGASALPFTVPVPLGFGGLSAFDAWWVDPTHIVASDSGSGLAVFRYTGPAPAVVP